MKLIKALGLLIVGDDTQRRSYGLFFCPECKKDVIKRMKNGPHSKTCSGICHQKQLKRNHVPKQPEITFKKRKGITSFYQEPDLVEQFYRGLS